jgi:transposase-like protein
MRVNQARKKFRCSRQACKIEFTHRKHTFFYGSNLNCAHILHIAYSWLNKSTQTQAIAQTGHYPNTITDFYKHFRQLVSSILKEGGQMIGGTGIIVQIDETKMGNRKYNRGHRVDGVWIIAGVELTSQRKIFLVRVQDRTADTILDIIARHVKPGSIIHTDMFKSHAQITPRLGFVHETVNHSQNFTNPTNGVNTNAIEGNNNALKIMIKPRNRTKNIEDHLMEFIWRRKNNGNLWGHLSKY